MTTTRERDDLRSKPVDGENSDLGSRVVHVGGDDGAARSLRTQIYPHEKVAVQGHTERC